MRRPTPRRRFPLWQISLTVVVAVLAVAGLVWVSGSVGSQPADTGVLGEGQAKGLSTAPVTIVEYADFQCPACRVAAEGVMKQIEQTYVADGRVRIEFRHFAFLGEESQQAARAAVCAADQGRFWDYHDLLFRSQAGENRGAFASPRLKELATRLGLDRTAFDQCLDSGQHAARVRAETEEGRRQGVTATPSFLVNGRLVVGGQPFDTFKQLIEAELARQVGGR